MKYDYSMSGYYVLSGHMCSKILKSVGVGGERQWEKWLRQHRKTHWTVEGTSLKVINLS